MRRPLRALVGGKWLALHLLFAALAVAMVLLGRWQLDVSDRKHFALQNFFYAFQWWTFTGFLLFFWFRLMRDALRPPPPTEATGEVVVARAGDAEPGPGAALMVADQAPGDEAAPAVYRGYVMPQMARDPERVGSDVVRDGYNDQLWQLALADAARGEGPMPTAARPLVDVPTLEARAAEARTVVAQRELARRDAPALPPADLGRDPDSGR